MSSAHLRTRVSAHAFIIIAAAWTAVALLIELFIVAQIDRTAEDAALVTAQSEVRRDIVYRRWVAERGGVYVVPSDAVEPNPWLTVPDRDVRTEDGLELTLVNPAFMTRLVHELALTSAGIEGHITSLDPIRPENAPAPWEVSALESIESPDDEWYEATVGPAGRILRYMSPLVTEESCLACHADQGYELGQVRGGISVTVPLSDHIAVSRASLVPVAASVGVVWLLGLAGIGVAGRRVIRDRSRLADAHDEVNRLLEEKRLLLREVQHRVKNNLAMMESTLRLQQHSAIDEATGEALSLAAAKFAGMNALYERLYESEYEDSARADLLVEDIVYHAVSTGSLGTRISTEIALEPATMDAKILAPLAILVTEAVTNTLKHGFRDRDAGIIRVGGTRDGETYRLSLGDDGHGFAGVPSGFGTTLIRALAEQIGAELTIDGACGMTITLRIPVSR